MENKEKSPDGFDRRREVYSNLFDKGYSFCLNVNRKFMEECVEGLRKKGLEVYVGIPAFRTNGTEAPEMRSIFTRKKDIIYSFLTLNSE